MLIMIFMILMINFAILVLWSAFIGIKYLVLNIIERIKAPHVKCEVIYEKSESNNKRRMKKGILRRLRKWLITQH